MRRKKKKSPRGIIESQKNFRLESGYVKFPGEEMQIAHLRRNEDSVGFDEEKILKKLHEQYNKNKGNFEPIYTEVHTHPTHESPLVSGGSIGPILSGQDMKNFLNNPNMAAMVIAETDINSGKVRGYFVIRKDELKQEENDFSFGKK